MLKARKIFACFIWFLGIAVIISSFSLGKSFVKYDIGPNIYPRVLGVFICALSMIVFVRPGTSEGETAVVIFDRSFFLHLSFMIAYVFIVNYLGFIISTTLVMIPMIMIMGQKKMPKVLALSFISSLVIYLVFSKLLSVPLPKGILKFI